MKVDGIKVTTNWKVGVVPAVVGGLAIYITSRLYYNDGWKELYDDLKYTEGFFASNENHDSKD